MSYKVLSQIGFIHELKEITDGPHARKVCFVLGAGASKSSGIKMGQELVDIWEKELIERNKDDYLQWKSELKITEDNKYNFYSQYYEKRFQQCPMDGLNFLEKIMEHVNPGVGYVMLAEILANTRHNVVITTNFDHLIEDALNYYSHEIPLVIGHESLAHYISKQITRPMIIKIHRDLLFDPKNTVREVEQLNEAWKNALDLVFSEYHPVFIGYAGNDKSLMNYLIENEDKYANGTWKFPYWMLYKSSDPQGKVREFLEKAGGYCINCGGFDELLCFIGEELGYKVAKEEDFINDAKKRYEKLSESFENIVGYKGKETESAGKEDAKTLGQVVQMLTNSDDILAKSIKAISLHNQGRYQEALELKRELVAQEPENARYHDSLAVTLHAMGKYEKACEEAEKAVKLEPENARYHDRLGVTLHAMGQYEKAREEEEKAIELEPENARYHDGLGVTLHEMGKYEKAREEEEKAVELEPENAPYHGNLGVTLHAMGKYEEARIEKEKAIELEPENARYHDSLGITLHEMGQYEEARIEKEKAIELEPENARYHNSLGVTLHEMGQYEEARMEKEKAVELELENARYHNNLGITLHEMGKYEEARIEREKAVELEPENARYHNSLGVTLHEMGQYEKAREEEEKAIELEPENACYHDSLGITLHAMGKYEEAREEEEKAIELEPENADYHGSLGVILHAMGQEGVNRKRKSGEIGAGECHLSRKPGKNSPCHAGGNK